MTYNVTDLDRETYETLLPIAGIEDTDALYEGMSNVKMSYDGMTTEEIFNSKYKESQPGRITLESGLSMRHLRPLRKYPLK